MQTNNLTIEALQALFLSFPSQERTGNERELVKVYLMAVEGIPADFIAMACKRFIQGQVERPSLTFRPTPAELAVECRRLQDKAWQAAKASALLTDSNGDRRVPERSISKPFIPYPRLWEALASEPELLKELRVMTFDGMTGVSKLMATEGIEAAKAKLRSMTSLPDRTRAAA